MRSPLRPESTSSPEPTLARYELRGTPGDTYDEGDAVTIATHLPADPREFLTPFGLTQPGTRATFKVFVILQTGNEAGSAPMTVERPALAEPRSATAVLRVAGS